MKNTGLILLLMAGAYYFMSMPATAQPTGSPVVATLTTDQKRRAINVWWETSTSPNDQATDGGRFEDIINNIAASEIDTIYTYLTVYVEKGLRPPVGSPVYNAMQVISNNYQIFV